MRCDDFVKVYRSIEQWSLLTILLCDVTVSIILMFRIYEQRTNFQLSLESDRTALRYFVMSQNDLFINGVEGGRLNIMTGALFGEACVVNDQAVQLTGSMNMKARSIRCNTTHVEVRLSSVHSYSRARRLPGPCPTCVVDRRRCCCLRTD